MPLRAILFEFDCTLRDGYPVITASVNHVRASHGLPALSVDEVKIHVGRGLPFLLQHTVPGTNLEADAALYREHHASVLAMGTQLLPEVAHTLSQLHVRNIMLAVCSNKPVQFNRLLVQQLGIASFFSEVLGPEDATRPKPAPDMLSAPLKQLEVEANEVFFVGHMTVDIETARSAGVSVWVVATGSESVEKLLAAKPDRILSRFSELLGLL